ncbi:acetate--CoA ligase family protein [Acetobacteraceae bacterium H6797]|nr:acetate--CoA ligase family protein [Acetobacteraceae bacterium H6797]
MLARLLKPRSVAVLGASPRPGAFGLRVLENLAGFEGRVFPVNPRYEAIGERTCFPSLKDLPEAPDCVVIATAKETVAPLLEEAIAAGASGVVVFASGYAETGDAAGQAALAARAREAGVALLGPNCLGFLNNISGAGVTFSAGPKPVRPATRALGIVSQSGAIGFGLAQAMERGVSISHVLTSGNAAGVDAADLVGFLAEDEDTAAIAVVLEGLAAPRRLMEAIALAGARGKRVVAHKMAASAAAAEAALSHTGAVAGGHAIWCAALREAGAVLVDELGLLVETAAFFAKAPLRPAGPGVAVISTSGGAGVIAADAAEAAGVAMPQPGEAAAAVLAARIPDYGSTRNPCDVTAQVLNDPAALGECAGALAADPAYGALLYPNTYAYPFSTRRMPVLAEIAAKEGKLLCVPWLSELREVEGAVAAERHPHVALFSTMRGCMGAIAAWQAEPPVAEIAYSASGDEKSAAAQLLTAGGKVLTEAEGKTVLAAYGIPVVPDERVENAEQAVAAAEALGYPVVLKVESPDILHKTEAGAVALDLRDAAAVRAAHAACLANAARAVPGARIRSVLVQPMLPRGVEVMVGARRDPLFGPVVVAGLGGVMVEVLGDVALGLAPISEHAARRLLESLKGAALLRGFRGAPPVDMARLAGIVARVAALAAEQEIAEIDVNPLLCLPDGRILAADALIVRA